MERKTLGMKALTGLSGFEQVNTVFWVALVSTVPTFSGTACGLT